MSSILDPDFWCAVLHRRGNPQGAFLRRRRPGNFLLAAQLSALAAPLERQRDLPSFERGWQSRSFLARNPRAKAKVSTCPTIETICGLSARLVPWRGNVGHPGTLIGSTQELFCFQKSKRNQCHDGSSLHRSKPDLALREAETSTSTSLSRGLGAYD